MSGKVWLAAMVAGSVLVIVAGSRKDPDPQPEAPRLPLETPWLTREAAAEVIGPDGGLGPLFAGVVLGGSAPSPALRARIAEFARKNKVEIELEIADDELAAVRFEVMYGGCCGYEGADALAARLGRPRTGGGCMGGEPSWLDDWAISLEDGTHYRARVRVNRLKVRWERQLTLEELFVRAERLLGADRGDVSSAARDRWIETEPGKSYELEIPYAFNTRAWDWSDARDRGIRVVVDRRKIVEVSFSLRDVEEPGVPGALRSHWGRPRVHGDNDTWTWRKPDRIVTADLGPDSSMTTIALRLR